MKKRYILLTGLLMADFVSAKPKPPFEVTEPETSRPRCADYDVNRKPYFGETHLHTGLSFDASTRFVNTRPNQAYDFAKAKGSLTLPDANGAQTVNVVIDRALDWGAVTDHSEFFGEMGVCKDYINSKPEARYSLECQLLNGDNWTFAAIPNNDTQYEFSGLGFQMLVSQGLGPASFNKHLPVCTSSADNREQCDAAEAAVWGEIRQAAEDAYDRTPNCTFTSFNAYEVTSTPSGTTWHRNVIFRNDKVVAKPITAIDMAVESNPDVQKAPAIFWTFDSNGNSVPPKPENLWNGLDWSCLQGHDTTPGTATRCDVLTIPHNTNIGGGVKAPNGMVLIPPSFYPPGNTALAEQRANWEPLVEIFQVKGSSECRFDPRAQAGVLTTDEFCNFELLDGLGAPSAGVNGSTAPSPSDFSPNAFVRNVWKDGLSLADSYKDAAHPKGINPFKMGVVSGSDAHTGVLGWHPENRTWPGHAGYDDAIPTRSGSAIENNTGGYTVAWAEENSRDAIFSALKRKETYGTSGTRPIVRFFAGWDANMPSDLCAKNFVPYAYQNGVPMGGELDALPKPTNAKKPRFIVAAWKDDMINTPLQQIQIIKGWVDPATQQTYEEVVHVAGDDAVAGDAPGGVDTQCRKLATGYDQLCKVWTDKNFNPKQRAFYYARVLETPVCRWSTDMCQANYGLNPLKPAQCKNTLNQLRASDNPEDRQKAVNGAACCNNETTKFNIVQPVIQERAWTSPIWYEPAQ